MSGPINEDPAVQSESPERTFAQDEAARAKKREQNRRYRERHPEQYAATRRRWVEAHRDHVRDMNQRWRAEHLDRAREMGRDSMRRSAVRKRREAEVRARGRDRANRWREEHPERVRDYQKRWVEENREKVREYYNRYYATHRDEVNARAAVRRDADPERTRQVSRDWAERNKDRRAEYQRIRRSDPAIYQAELGANAAARRLKRRLERAGLPPKRLHLVSAAERRANEREAERYFGDPSRSEHLRQFTVFAETLTEHMLKNGVRMMEFAEAYAARRARIGLPPVDVERLTYARAVEIVTERVRRVDQLTSRDIAAAVRSTNAVVRQEERRQQYDRLVRTLVKHVDVHLARLCEEAVLEDRARRLRGKPRVSFESLVVQLAIQEIVPQVSTGHLNAEDARKAGRAARVRIAMTGQGFDSPSGNADPRPVIRYR